MVKGFLLIADWIYKTADRFIERISNVWVWGTLLLLAVLVCLWWCSPMIMLKHHAYTHNTSDISTLTHDELGTFGDSFGHINSLFSGAALVLVIVSVMMQGKELKQFSTTFKKDSFERTFFNMISLFNEGRGNISGLTRHGGALSSSNPICHGQMYIGVILDNLKTTRASTISTAAISPVVKWDVKYPDTLEILKRFQKDHTTILDILGSLETANACDSFNMCMMLHGRAENVDQYIRIVKNTLSFMCDEVDPIDTKSREDSMRYARIFWGQFSEQEIEFLMIHAYANSGTGKGIGEYFELVPPDADIIRRMEEKYSFLSKF